MTPAAAERRVGAVDLVRGIVMVLMALDHGRDFFSELRIAPEDLSRATPALFFTRWITHFCAPTFFLLAGVGVGIMHARGRSTAKTSRFLVTRGLWLLVLELTVSAFGWSFQLTPTLRAALVIWALGWSMIILAALIWLPRAVIATLAVITIAGHNLLDGVAPQSLGTLAPLWQFLHVPGFLVPGFLIGYPIIPWFAVMALGFVLGPTFVQPAEHRRATLVRIGVAATIAFVVIRFVNGYGDPAPWAPQRTSALTVASFFNLRKYPPSLDYLLMTLGPSCLALAYADRARGRVAEWLTTIGRVPLFYYLVHIFVLHVMAIVVALVQHRDAGFLFRASFPPDGFPDWYGVDLVGVYLLWALSVVILYIPCRWFAGVKSRRRDWWLGYL